MMSAMYATVDNPEDKTNYTAAYTKRIPIWKKL